MHIIYAVTTCSDRVYRQLFEDAPRKPAFQSQKYHRLLIEGLAAGAKVDVVANPPVNREVLKKPFVRLPRETEGGACYRYIPAVRNPIVKAVFVGVGTFFRTAHLAGKDSAVVVDCLNRTTALAGLLAAKLRGRRCVGIVTDLPDMLGGSAFSKKLSNFVIRHCTDYVLLTQAMNDYLNPEGKPHVILEGHSDIAMERQEPSPARKASPRVCMYAGGVSKQYGLENLVKGFRKADLPDARLEIYGPGDYVQELSQIAAEDSRIFYGGMLLNAEIVEREMAATLLVNPRPTGEEYVKYSFPSKTMEYMSTGTPVLTTVLPGMPKEYHPYVYLLEEETADAIAEKLAQIFAQPAEALFEKGMAAREFILKEKNNVKQAGKILAMLERDGVQ
jgi:glycosyltransferase involved in cell wall biosynthesis